MHHLKKIISYLLSHYIISSSSLIFFAIILFSFSADLGYLPIYEKKITVPHYDGQAQDPKLSQVKNFKEHNFLNLLNRRILLTATNKKLRFPYFKISRTLEIQADFTIPKNNQTIYADLLQTSDINQGLRVELYKRANEQYMAGVVIYNAQSEDHLWSSSFGMVPHVFVPGKKYSFVVKIDKDSAFVSNDFYVHNGQQLGLMKSQGDFHDYAIDKIKVGSGFTRDRTFKGKIDNFQMTYTYYLPTYMNIAGPWIASFLLLLALFIAVKGNQEKIQFSWHRDKKYILSALCIFAYPIVQLYAVNIINTNLLTIAKLILLAVSLAVFVFFGLLSIYKRTDKAILGTLIFAFYLFFPGRIYENIKHIINPDVFIFLCLLSLLLLYIFLQVKRQNLNSAKFAMCVCYFLFIMSVTTLLYRGSLIAYTTIKDQHLQSSMLVKTEKNYKPDIYFILSDMHASQISQEKHLGYTNGMLKSLKAKGFYIADNAASNYKLTWLSVPSMLNYSFIPPNFHTDKELADYFDSNQLAVFLKSIGYKYIFVNPSQPIIPASKIADVNLVCNNVADFQSTLLNYSLFFKFNLFGNAYRNNTLCGFKNIKKAALITGPKFVFVHILSPHPPYVFDSHGNEVPFENQKDLNQTSSIIVLNKHGYLEQLKFVSEQLNQSVDFILKNSKQPPIIIIQGDHGFSLVNKSEYATGAVIPPPDVVNARMRVLAAYYFPKGGDQVLYSTITPVNMVRGLLRYYFGRSDLVKIADNSYWSAEINIFQHVDVTAMVRKQDI